MTITRRERLKQELRDDILDSARKLFVEEGYESVSMRKIADEVGCSPGTLYLYYEDKPAILGAICVETFSKLTARLEAIKEDAKADPLERLRRAGRTYIQFGVDHPHHYLLTFGRKHWQQAEPVHAVGGRCFAGLRECVQRALDAGALRSDDADCVAQVLWAATHGVVMLLVAQSDFPFIEHSRLIESALDTMIEGIRARS